MEVVPCVDGAGSGAALGAVATTRHSTDAAESGGDRSGHVDGLVDGEVAAPGVIGGHVDAEVANFMDNFYGGHAQALEVGMPCIYIPIEKEKSHGHRRGSFRHLPVPLLSSISKQPPSPGLQCFGYLS